MKFNIETKNLINALKFSNSVCGMNSSYSPLLSCILFDVTEEKITIISSCSSASGKYTIQGDKYKCEEPGKFLVKAKVINDIVSKLDSDIINFTLLESNQLSISCNGFESTLLLLDYNEYPNIDFVFDPGNIAECKFKTNQLLEIEGRISNLVSSDDSTTIFRNINIDINNNVLVAGATDSFKLGSLKYETESDNVKFNIDPHSLKLITSFFKPDEEVIFKIKDENKARIDYNEMTIIVRLNEGKFPNFEHFNNIKDGDKFTIDRKKLVAALERGAIVIPNKTTPSVRFKIKEDNKLSLTFKSNEIGNVEETLEIKETTNKNINFHLNIQLLLNVLKNFTGDTLTIWYKEDMGMTFFQDIEQENFFQVVATILSNSW